MTLSGAARLILTAGFLAWMSSASAATPPIITDLQTGIAPFALTFGSDGNLWFAEQGAIGKISQSGAIQLFALPDDRSPKDIAAGPDGNLWFADQGCVNCNPAVPAAIGRITLSGTITIFPQAFSVVPVSITGGPNGNLWFTDAGNIAVAEMTPAGALTEFALPETVSVGRIIPGPQATASFLTWGFIFSGANQITAAGMISEFGLGLPGTFGLPQGIALGADGNIWFTVGGCTIGSGCTEDILPMIVRVAPSGTETKFSEGLDGTLGDITAGADGNLWSIEGSFLDRITPSGDITQFPLDPGSNAQRVIAGPDGNLWVSNILSPDHSLMTTGTIDRVTLPTDTLTVTLAGDGSGQVIGPPTGAPSGSGIGCGTGLSSCSTAFFDTVLVTLTATATAGSTFQGWSGPGAIAAGCSTTASCTIALTGNADSRITASFALVPTTANLTVTRSGNGTLTSLPSGIACGTTCTASFSLNEPITLSAVAAAGFTFTAWNDLSCSGVGTCTLSLLTDTTVQANFIADSSSDIILVSAVLPTSRSVEVGATATVFGTMINASSDTSGTTCSVRPSTSIPASFSFQATNPANNDPVGAPNLPVTLQPGASQSFVLAMTPTAPFDPTDVAFSFSCANSQAATSSSGLNTLLLSASTMPVPDIVALAATAGSNGIVQVPGSTGTGAFAVATVNVGSIGTITASADAGAANLPVIISLCQTVPSTGACVAAPTPAVTTSIDAGAEPTFAIFVQGHGTVPFQPAANRVFVRFRDPSGAVRGSTSVAVRTVQ